MLIARSGWLGGLPVTLIHRLFLLLCATLSRADRCVRVGRWLWQRSLWHRGCPCVDLLRSLNLIKRLFHVLNVHFHRL